MKKRVRCTGGITGQNPTTMLVGQEQARYLIKCMRKERRAMEALPPRRRKAAAIKLLQSIGYLDKRGRVAPAFR